MIDKIISTKDLGNLNEGHRTIIVESCVFVVDDAFLIGLLVFVVDCDVPDCDVPFRTVCRPLYMPAWATLVT